MTNSDAKIIFLSEETEDTPYVIINSDGQILIKGISLMINAYRFYLSIFWAINKIESNNINIRIELIKANAATVRYISLMLKILLNHMPDMEIKIEWCYCKNDRDIYEYGKMFEELLPKINFCFVESSLC